MIAKKTTSRGSICFTLKIDGNVLEQVTKFKYLSTELLNSGNIENEVRF